MYNSTGYQEIPAGNDRDLVPAEHRQEEEASAQGRRSHERSMLNAQDKFSGGSEVAVHLTNSAQAACSPVSLEYSALRLGTYRLVGKRALDLALTIMAAPFALFLLALAILCIALEGGQPFYSQMRVGRNGRLYRIWKLRTMVVGAEEKLVSHLAQNPEADAEWNRMQKLKSDPRITRLGKHLRKTSIDELPQLWNVLCGDMSLIGPRPIMPHQQKLYAGQDYYALRPGITGLWQVSLRNESSFAARARFDTSYNRNLSLRTDLGILFKTVMVICRATGR